MKPSYFVINNLSNDFEKKSAKSLFEISFFFGRRVNQNRNERKKWLQPPFM